MDAEKKGKKQLSFFAVLIPLSCFVLFSYGLLLNKLGFYWDDWPYVWTRLELGYHGLLRHFSFSRPVGWLLDAWADLPGRISTILSIFFLVGLYIWIGLNFRADTILPGAFSPTGAAAEGIAPANVLILPLGATFVWFTGTVLGLWIFRRKGEKGIAELVWGASCAAVLQFLVAAVMNFH